jgi:protein-tyrosine phosphatase
MLEWEGCNNVRDLGGLRTCDGRLTRHAAIVRGDTPSRLTPQGWAALHEYGIRTILTLRTHGMTENELDFASPYAGIVTLQAAIEDITDQEFLEKWARSGLWSTPLYYKDALQRWPSRHAAAISAIARAQPGGVLFHCIRGVDRTGIIALLLLALVGAAPDEIIADYALSPDPERDVLLAEQHASIPAALLGALEGLDIDGYLLAGGATRDDLAAVQARLLG